jgi:hypothetical protein
MALLPLGKGILPVVFLKGSKVSNAINAKVYNNGIGIMLGEVTKTVKHLCHHLAAGGLQLIILTSPRPFRVFWLVGLIVLLHLGGGGAAITGISITIIKWIPITASWRGSWALLRGSG